VRRVASYKDLRFRPRNDPFWVFRRAGWI